MPPTLSRNRLYQFFVPVLEWKHHGENCDIYDHLFDAPTTVTHNGTSHVMILGFGKIGNDGWCKYSLLFQERLCDYPPAAAGCFVNDADLVRTITSRFTSGRAGQSKDKDTELKTVPTGRFKI